MIDLLSRTAGAALGAVFGTVARVRPSLRPLHPRGHVTTGTLVRDGLNPPTGARWVDEPGSDRVLVRRSKSAGLPGRLPDIHGLAVRVPGEGTRFGDLLLATTGTRPGTRHLLAPTTSDQRPMTTLMPYRTPSGPLLLGAFPAGDRRTFDLRYAHLTGPWQHFGVLEVDDTAQADEGADDDLRFDPVLHPVPGLDTYRWISRLREPAYREARRNSPSTTQDPLSPG